MTTASELRERVRRFLDQKRPTELEKEIAKEILRKALDAKGEPFGIESRKETRDTLRKLGIEPYRKKRATLVLLFPETRKGAHRVEYKLKGEPEAFTRDYGRKADAEKALKKLKETKRSKVKWARIEER